MADTTGAVFLFETGLPTRYYLPKTDVRMDMLTPTDRATRCPYKGTARYWTVQAAGEAHENFVWGYDAPLPESQKILGTGRLLQREGRHLRRRGPPGTTAHQVLLNAPRLTAGPTAPPPWSAR